MMSPHSALINHSPASLACQAPSGDAKQVAQDAPRTPFVIPDISAGLVHAEMKAITAQRETQKNWATYLLFLSS
jgi:hypothetical protein